MRSIIKYFQQVLPAIFLPKFAKFSPCDQSSSTFSRSYSSFLAFLFSISEGAINHQVLSAGPTVTTALTAFMVTGAINHQVLSACPTSNLSRILRASSNSAINHQVLSACPTTHLGKCGRHFLRAINHQVLSAGPT